MAVSQSDIDALTRALATGERQVTLGSQTVTYRSTKELIDARNELMGELAREQLAAAGKRRTKRVKLYYAGRGYDS